MNGILKSKDKSVEVHLFDDDIIEIEFQKFKDVSIEVKLVNPIKDVSAPKGSLYQIGLYKSEQKAKGHPFEYDTVWVMPDGIIIHRKDRKYLNV
jgi:hypothetical protein